MNGSENYIHNLERRHLSQLVNQRMEGEENRTIFNENHGSVGMQWHKSGTRQSQDPLTHLPYPIQEEGELKEANDVEADDMSMVVREPQLQRVRRDVYIASQVYVGQNIVRPPNNNFYGAGLQSASGFSDDRMNIPERGNIQGVPSFRTNYADNYPSQRTRPGSSFGQKGYHNANNSLPGAGQQSASGFSDAGMNIPERGNISVLSSSCNGSRLNAGHTSASSMRTSTSFQNDSMSHISSSLYRTAPATSMLQGAEDRIPDQHRARHPEYADFQARFGTYGNFPTTVNQHVQSLAKAGLFYTGKTDACKCFYCGGVIHSWSKDDKPLFEHARYFPHCDFVIQQMVQDPLSIAGRENQVQDSVTRGQDFGGGLDVIQEIEIVGYERVKIVNAVEEYKRRVRVGRVSKGEDKINAVLDILKEESDLEKGHQSRSTDQKANRMDARYCSACKLQKATVSQQKCGHIVCGECAPRPSDPSHHCKFCQQEVVGCYPIDTSFFHTNCQF